MLVSIMYLALLPLKVFSRKVKASGISAMELSKSICSICVTPNMLKVYAIANIMAGDFFLNSVIPYQYDVRRARKYISGSVILSAIRRLWVIAYELNRIKLDGVINWSNGVAGNPPPCGTQ